LSEELSYEWQTATQYLGTGKVMRDICIYKLIINPHFYSLLHICGFVQGTEKYLLYMMVYLYK